MIPIETLQKARRHLETRKEIYDVPPSAEQVDVRNLLGGVIPTSIVLDIMDILIAGEYDEFERKLEEMGYYDLVS